MNCQIAVTGRADSGKTGVAALMARLMRDSNVKPVLAMEADPGGGFGAALEMRGGERVSDVVEEVLGTEGESKELLLDRRLQQECVSEGRGMDFVDLGRPEGMDAHCYLNNALREALTALKANYRAVVLDCEPRLIHLKRMNMDDVNCLLIVSEPVSDQITLAAEIAGAARELGTALRRVVLLLTGPGAAASVSRASFDAAVESPQRLVLPGPDAPLRGEIPVFLQSMLKLCLTGIKTPALGRLPGGAAGNLL